MASQIADEIYEHYANVCSKDEVLKCINKEIDLDLEVATVDINVVSQDRCVKAFNNAASEGYEFLISADKGLMERVAKDPEAIQFLINCELKSYALFIADNAPSTVHDPILLGDIAGNLSDFSVDQTVMEDELEDDEEYYVHDGFRCGMMYDETRKRAGHDFSVETISFVH